MNEMYIENTLENLIPFFGLAWFFILLFLLIVFALSLLFIITRWIIFRKAGLEGWESIVPFYSSWSLVKISGISWWFFFIINAPFFALILSHGLLTPFAGIAALIASYFLYYNLALKFGKEPIGYGLGLTFLPIIFYPILAFGKSTYKDVNVSSYGPISENTINNNLSTNDKKNKNNKFCKNCGNQIDESKFCSNCGTKISK
ncbi:MAG: DUF5684 domain-containing protein [Bacilli bacterium]|nr:DUF5684 domain-containing protein [Bacilli bacterium]MDD4406654.1 DUF5684 domain-containing protein [Bacilli bacterium]